MSQVAQPPQSDLSKDKDQSTLLTLTVIIIFGIFATTLPQPQVLGKLPLQFLMKNTLHVQRSDMAKFFLLCGLAWYVKPLAGILTDAFPIFGTRRRHYMLISCILAAISWIGVFVAWNIYHTYNALLIGAIIVNLFMVMASTVTGAFLVEAGQSFGATGRLTSVRMFVQNACTFLNGYAGGLLASVAFLWAAGVNAVLILTLVPVTYIFLREKKVRQGNTDAFSNAGNQLTKIGKSSTLWWGLVFIFLFYFAPGFSTLLFYKQTDPISKGGLGFDPQTVGLLQSIGGGMGLLGAVVYGFLIKKLNLRTMIFVGIGTAGLFTLFYLFYNSKPLAMLIDGQNGFFFTLAEIALMDLAARSTPVGCEGLGYGLILSIRNVALFGADYVGSYFADSMKIPFNTMVYVNAGTTLVVLVLLPFLPAAVMKSRDAMSQGAKELRAAPEDVALQESR